MVAQPFPLGSGDARQHRSGLFWSCSSFPPTDYVRGATPS
jgi:hypothetical protein